LYQYSHLENTIHKSNIQLTVTTKNIEKLYNDLQCLDVLFQTTKKKYTYQLMSGSYLEELRGDRQSSKVKLKPNYRFTLIKL